jgi:hypothetical protein
MATSWLFIGDDSAGCAHCGRPYGEHIAPSLLCPATPAPAPYTLNLPLVRYNDDTQPALGDQNPRGSRHLLILYGPDDGEPNIEFVRRAVNFHGELVTSLRGVMDVAALALSGNLINVEEATRLLAQAQAVSVKVSP